MDGTLLYRLASCRLTLAGLAWVWVVLSAPAQEPSPADPRSDQPLRVARLVRELSDRDFELRARAREELALLGAATRAELTLAAKSDNLDTALAARDLLTRLDLAALWQGSRVQVDPAQRPAADVLALLAQQSGNRLLVGDQFGSFQNVQVSLSTASDSFWQTLDEVCRQSGNHVRPHYDASSPGLVVLTGDAGKYPVTYAGPVRAAVTSARRQFVEEFDYRGLGSEQTHTFQLNLQMMWEDRFRLVAYRSQPELVEATTDTGARLSSTQSTGNGWNVAGGGTRQLALSLRLSPPPVAAERLAVFRLRWGLIAVGEMISVDVDLGDAETLPRVSHDGFELEVEQCQSTGARAEVTVVVVRDLVAPEPQEVLFQENGFELFDQQDRPFRQQGQTNNLTDEGARMRLSFSGAAPESVPRRLRVTYPRLRSQHDLEVAWRDVPLPTARPR